MGNKSKSRRPRQVRPQSTLQADNAVLQRMLENSMLRARAAEQMLEEMRLLLAGTILAAGGQVLLHDEDVAELTEYIGIDQERDDDAGTLLLYLNKQEDDDETEEQEDDGVSVGSDDGNP